MCGRYDTDLQLVVCGVGTHGTEDSRFARVWCKLLYVCGCCSNMHVSTMRSRQVAYRQDSGGTLTATQPEIHMAVLHRTWSVHMVRCYLNAHTSSHTYLTSAICILCVHSHVSSQNIAYWRGRQSKYCTIAAFRRDISVTVIATVIISTVTSYRGE